MKIIILSDIHANGAPLAAITGQVAEDFPGEAVRWIFLGDLFGYGSIDGAVECLVWLRQHCSADMYWTLGNHDLGILQGLDSRFSSEAVVSIAVQCAFLTRYDPEGLWRWFKDQAAAVLSAHRPGQIVIDDLTIVYTHAAAKQVTGVRDFTDTYLFPWQREPWNSLPENLAYLDTFAPPERHACLLYGHTHYTVFARYIDRRAVPQDIHYGIPLPLGEGRIAINPGSAGQPRDGDHRATYAVLDTQARTIQFQRVPYTISSITKELQQDGKFDAQHLLAWEERLAILTNLAKLDHRLMPGSDEAERVAKIYQKLIAWLESADGGASLFDYRRIYCPEEWGLRVAV